MPTAAPSLVNKGQPCSARPPHEYLISLQPIISRSAAGLAGVLGLPPAQDGGAGRPALSCLKGHEGRCAAVFQFRVEPARRQKRSPGGCDGRGGGQAGRAAVHQRGSRARQRRGPRLLPDLGVSAVGGHRRHPRPHRPLRLHLLPARLRPALPAPDSQSGKEVEQIF